MLEVRLRWLATAASTHREDNEGHLQQEEAKPKKWAVINGVPKVRHATKKNFEEGGGGKLQIVLKKRRQAASRQTTYRML